jgi:hypothetical protein
MIDLNEGNPQAGYSEALDDGPGVTYPTISHSRAILLSI